MTDSPNDNISFDVHATPAGGRLIHDFVALRTTLLSDSGTPYIEFVRTLAPRYLRVWSSIAAGYLGLLASAAALITLRTRLSLPAPIAAVLGALLFGFWIHYLILFFHEALHFNLAATRKRNDRLASVLICPLLGLDLSTLRESHFEHHRHLGTPIDTEISYFSALTPRSILESLTGIRTARALVAKRRAVQRLQPTASVPWAALLGSAALHTTIVAVTLWAGQPTVAIAWLLAMAFVAPSLNFVRQTLEHRDFAARSDIDFTRVAHGPVARLFGDGLLASTFGAAGFNRHLLHHLEPQVSCTRLGDLERFLDHTTLAARLAECRCTYGTAFIELLRLRRE